MKPMGGVNATPLSKAWHVRLLSPKTSNSEQHTALTRFTTFIVENPGKQPQLYGSFIRAHRKTIKSADSRITAVTPRIQSLPEKFTADFVQSFCKDQIILRSMTVRPSAYEAKIHTACHEDRTIIIDN